MEIVKRTPLRANWRRWWGLIRTPAELCPSGFVTVDEDLRRLALADRHLRNGIERRQRTLHPSHAEKKHVVCGEAAFF
jgi:hypothetical protein